MSFITENPDQKFTDLLSTLPNMNDLYQYEGFWYNFNFLEGVLQVQRQFQALPTDIIIAGWPKTGNTWLKALCFAIATRKQYQDQHDEVKNPLLNHLPHALIPFLETDFFKNPNMRDSHQYSILSTHMPYTSLPKTIASSGCKIIYICREPKDTFVSFWHFTRKLRNADSTLYNEVDLFSKGMIHYGPYWDHVLGFYRASLDRPDKFLFLKYEELVEDTVLYVKKLATFMNKPFSFEEEQEGIPEKIAKMCSFQSLSGLEVNKTGKFSPNEHYVLDNRSFFRKGNIGDWKNHLTEEMAEKIDRITAQKLQGSGFSFDLQSISP